VTIKIIGGGGGTDGPTITIVNGKIHHDPGWGPEALRELATALRIVREAAHLKTPGVAEAAIHGVIGFLERELGQHLKDGGVVVLGP
jgi:hypothetical protein